MSELLELLGKILSEMHLETLTIALPRRGKGVGGVREVLVDGRLSRLSGWMRRMGTMPCFWTRRRKTPKTQRKSRQRQLKIWSHGRRRLVLKRGRQGMSRQIWRIQCRLILKKGGEQSKKKRQKMCWKRSLTSRCRLMMACCSLWVHQSVRMQPPAVLRTRRRPRALSQTHHTFMRRSGTQLESSKAPSVATEDALAGN